MKKVFHDRKFCLKITENLFTINHIGHCTFKASKTQGKDVSDPLFCKIYYHISMRGHFTSRITLKLYLIHWSAATYIKFLAIMFF